ncbi:MULTISPECIES: ROK family protein [unclassified Streptococcus]|uniref:ROK family protein n=1 Tax=unclassified Streptococcus TaxID=2608887 RepID=UPI001072BFF1|nr:MULTISPECIES: ROK family protein [unclassified Streptococcus]MBF0786432.1 ROK family protein [Streptococcus sp. 19428wC2_LYSM12]MCQ9212539.1 ROK family protein [Streptococcus sp. B01]MCQ9213878.1 ROK family protein [Streptococcus sp. O1]TFV06840.1 ROK family protein [Streptococcus sp. LYSM12]
MKNATYYLALDIGGTFIKYSLMSEDFHLLEQDKTPTPATMEEFLACLENLVETYHDQIVGIAISCPGTINRKTGFVYKGGLIPYLISFPLAQYLENRFTLPVSVLNDADAAALAEARLGNLTNVQCGATLVLGTGVGLALVRNGNLATFTDLRASNLLLNPIGQSLFDKGTNSLQEVGAILDLHLRGIKSLVANTGSAVQFVEQASQQLQLPEADGVIVFKNLQEENNPDLSDLFDDYCQEIAYLMVNMTSFVKLDKIVIGGGISQQDLLIDRIRNSYQEILTTERIANHLPAPVEIQACHFHNQANLIGALCFYIEKYKTS